MKILPKNIVKLLLVLSLFCFSVDNVDADNTCCSTDQCMSAYCPSGGDCSSTCEGAGVGCFPPGTCYMTYGTANQCEGVPYGPCIDGCQTRTCEDCYTSGGVEYCSHILNIQGCDGMACGRTTDGTGSCHPASVPPPAPSCDQTGLLHKYFMGNM
jgi:hypothetical protein